MQNRLPTWVVLALVGCANSPRAAQPSAVSQKPVAAQASSTSPDPPPHWHAYPEIPPDDLSRAAEDASAVKPVPPECAKLEPPPAPRQTKIHGGPPMTNYIPPEVIKRPIRARAECFRRCYEQGLLQNPALSGRVVIRYVIEEDGWVRKAKVQDADSGARDVAECIAQSFVGLEYPIPEGRVTVVYPLVLGEQ